MTNAELFAAHLRTRQTKVEAALAATGFDALVLQAGRPFTYFADDQDAPFHPTPHFAHACPLAGPQHLLCFRHGAKPLLVAVKPEDYWYEQAPLGKPFWIEGFDVREVADEAAAWKLVPLDGRVAYVGDDAQAAQAHGLGPANVQPMPLLARLDWDRAYKTPYEVACLEAAEERAAKGHKAARSAFVEGASELEIHAAYVAAVGCVDKDLPYETIIALDEKGAILHYCGKRARHGPRAKVLLIDAGAKVHGYGSDITRTWTTDGADPLFRELVAGLDRAQQELCALVKPGLPYLDLHRAAHVKIADLLRASGVIKRGGEEAVAMGLTHPFFPHGLGHFLGIQVHDVGGRQKSPDGGTQPPPPEFPFLRTTRAIEEDQVFTVEPGIYFIDMLLRPHRGGKLRGEIDWAVVDRLASHGGIRIEDNVLVTRDGHRNLTRPRI
jgi:Xaa-Pro dipeptidase